MEVTVEVEVRLRIYHKLQENLQTTMVLHNNIDWFNYVRISITISSQVNVLIILFMTSKKSSYNLCKPHIKEVQDNLSTVTTKLLFHFILQ